jgi:hypothetical protein
MFFSYIKKKVYATAKWPMMRLRRLARDRFGLNHDRASRV